MEPEATKIRFVLQATLHEVAGSARLTEGKIRFDLERGSAAGVVRVDARSATTGIGMRDRRMHAQVLESERFPEIRFVAERVRGLGGGSPKRSGAVEGRISIHGVERPLALPIEAAVDEKRACLRSRFVIPYVEWGMKDVSTFMLWVGKTVEVRVDACGTVDLLP
ncbi:MAG TPA: YceI family protein [Candidatus Acidoferrales bacterium]|nr:YceI family protein [Candidatus Acidoferrales bacterium]